MREIPFPPDWMRKFSEEHTFVGIEGGIEEGNSNTADIEDLKQKLRFALGELTERQLECIKLYYWEGMTQEEIGEELGISQPAVVYRLSSAIARIEKSKHFVKLKIL